MTPHLTVSSHPAHHLLDALPPSHHRRRRRRRFCPPRARASPSVRCCAAAAAASVPRAVEAAAAAARTRVFVVSDLHTDYPENMDWVRRLAAGVGSAPGAAGAGGVNALVVAGDVAETRDNFARTMEALRDQFDAVFYVPGNHDLWLRREGGRYVSRFISFRHPLSLSAPCPLLFDSL